VVTGYSLSRVRVARVAAAIGAVALVVVISATAWSWRHPDAFPTYGGYEQGLTRPAPDGPHYFGMTWGSDGGRVVTARSADPVVVANSARADVKILVCRVRAGSDGSLVGVVDAAEAKRFCDLGRVEGASLNLRGTPPATQVVVEVTPRQAGRVVIDGVTLHYSQGWRSGTQHIGGRIDFRIG
jgi:hypothetical protein